MRLGILFVAQTITFLIHSQALAAFERVPPSNLIAPGTRWLCAVTSQNAHSIDSRAAWRDRSAVSRVRDVSFTFGDPPAAGSKFIVRVAYEKGEPFSFTAHTNFFADAGSPELLFSTLGGTGYFYLSPLNAGIERPGFLYLNENGYVFRALQLYCTWEVAPGE